MSCELTVKKPDLLQEIFRTSEDYSRCLGSLAKVARHLNETVTVTGGIAADWHLLKSEKLVDGSPINDIDLVVEDLSALPPSLSNDFLISHFHPSRERGKILIQLVDEEYSTRIDIFTRKVESLLERLTHAFLGETSVRFVSAEDLLPMLLSLISPVVSGTAVERKYAERFNSLLAAADLEMVRALWHEYRQESQPSEFDEAAEAVRRRISAGPALLQAASYDQDIHSTCSWCNQSKLFPLASRPRIYEILGYV
jgi:hypothetical protein